VPHHCQPGRKRSGATSLKTSQKKKWCHITEN